MKRRQARTILYRPKEAFITGMTQSVCLQLYRHWASGEGPFREALEPSLDAFMRATRHCYRTREEQEVHWRAMVLERLEKAPGRLAVLFGDRSGLPPVVMAEERLRSILRRCPVLPSPSAWGLMDAGLRQAYVDGVLYALLEVGVETEVSARVERGREAVAYCFSGRTARDFGGAHEAVARLTAGY
ncbi:hypothetical protein T281_14130 [Rhodomicrobium udaipurense JA643]|uniref:Uncharacterized protein n=1 Tax=Rhodomicrobium udaipurense TaxID=1202716 RepID=A0A8I1GBK2_9HYPH|nr:hypothetical protein [Rhodomicrobium udaipurense]KAI93869.1 hypothetical protein T281_14130 [Rhodomicrobium udaipurense JA643]MBJ7541969.1 hypothetical protein [Rhodomicrobium udaipurense]